MYLDTTIGYHYYRVQVHDNEIPIHYSSFSDSLLGFGGIFYSYSEGFEEGRGISYVRGAWDTTQSIAHTGNASLTDSPLGNYSNSANTSILIPPVIVGPNMALTFSHIAIIAGADFGFVEISSNHNVSYTTLRGYNWLLHPEWQDGHADPSDWYVETFSLASYVGDTVSIRFRLQTNSSGTADGWYIDDISIAPATRVGQNDSRIPTTFELEQNYPNPFNPSTTITYALPAFSSVRLTIFNILGEEIATLVDTEQPAGWHNAVWKGTNSNNVSVGSGLYFYRLEATGSNGIHFQQQQKMLLLK